MILLVDTNVYLDYFLEREGAEIAEQFFTKCVLKRNPIYITSMSLRDIGYTAHRQVHNQELAKDIQFAAYQLCSKVISISADTAINSLFSDMSDYEDSLIVEAAKEYMVDGIVTNNKKHFKDCNIPIFTPKELLGYWH